MLYFRVPKELDQKRYGKGKGDFFVVGELYTPGELLKLKINPERLEAVTVKKTDTYWCFGARFQYETPA